MWAVGCIIGSAIFRIRNLFVSEDEKEHLLEVTKIVGSEAMLRAIAKFNSSSYKDDRDFLNIEPMDLTTLINEANQDVATKEARDLIHKLLVCDPDQRYTADQAMRHPYFSRIRPPP